jgi:hypothetical protein
MPIYNYNHGRFFGPSQSYMGYVFIGVGIFCSYYSLIILVFIIPGLFMAFTSTGTIIDTDNKRVKPYTMFFGFIRTGKWTGVNQFSRFGIKKLNSRYSSYSRANIRLDINTSDIRLELINIDGTGKVLLNKYKNVEDAQKEKDRLAPLLFPERQNDHSGNNNQIASDYADN